jgi:hypothetical protein
LALRALNFIIIIYSKEGIQDVRSKYKQNWINHLERWTTPDFRNTPSTTNLEEEEIVDAPRKRWQRVDAGTGRKT